MQFDYFSTILAKCTILESFLIQELNVERDTARQDAVSCLCSLSEESIEKVICRVLGQTLEEPDILRVAGEY